jgi:hypothetical protein
MRCFGSAFFLPVAAARITPPVSTCQAKALSQNSSSSGTRLLRVTYLREHAASQIIRLVTGRVVAEQPGREAADGPAGLLRRVVLRQRRACQFFFLMRGVGALQDERCEASDTIRSFFEIFSVQVGLRSVFCRTDRLPWIKLASIQTHYG